MAKTLLLISERPEDNQFAAEVAKTAGLTLLTAKNAVLGAETIDLEGAPIVMVDTSDEKQYQAFEMAIQERMGLFSDKISGSAIHFISSDELEKCPYLIQSPLFSNFITRTYTNNPTEAGVFYGRLVAHSLAKRAFGLKPLLDETAKIQVVRLQTSTQKQDAIEAVRTFLIAARFQTRMATVIANAVDEILMNSIFDAPIDDVGRPIYKLTSRATQIKLEGRNAVEMHVGFDGKYVAITAIDLFGSLDKASLLSHITKVYTHEEYKVKGTVASAGIGLATIYRGGGSMLFVSESRVRTEVTVFFKRTDNFREFKDQFRFLATQFYF